MSSTTSISSKQHAANDDPDPEPDNQPSPEAAGNDLEKQVTNKSASEPEYLHGLKLWTMMSGVTLVAFLMLLDMSIVSTATPKITADFHSLSNVGWYGAAYQLSAATLQPLTGKLYTSFRTKWSFFAFFLLFELGSLLCGVATSSNMLIVGRAVAGMGGSGIQNGAITIISQAAPLPKRPMLMGVVFGFAQLGLVAGPLIGGVLTQFASWRWCFYINLPVGAVVAALLVFIAIPEPAPKPPAREVFPTLHKKLDLVGFVIFAPASIMLLLAVQWGGNQYAWNSSVVIGLLCGAVATAIVWGVWNRRKGDDAMIPFSYVRKRHVWMSCLVGGFLSGAMLSNSYWLPIYFQAVRNRTPAISGVSILPSIIAQLLSGILAGKLLGKWGYYLPWAVVSSMFQASGYGALSTLAPHTSAGKWIGFQILAGVGRGTGLTVPMIAVQNNLPPRMMPIVMALLMATQTYFNALFLSFGDTIFTNSLRSLLSGALGQATADNIAHAGAYGFRDIVPQGALGTVLQAYSTSIDRIFYMCIGLAGVQFVFSWGLGWVDIRKKQTPKGGKKENEKKEGEGMKEDGEEKEAVEDKDGDEVDTRLVTVDEVKT